jgi:hypothetical protein
MAARDDPSPTCGDCGVLMNRFMSLTAAPVFKGAGFHATEYGNMSHHLKPFDQRVRAQRECAENGLCVATPKRMGKRHAEKLVREAESEC